MPISTAIGMEKLSKYYIRFVRGGVLKGDVEKVIPEESVEDISTGSEEERKRERKPEKKTDKDAKKGKGNSKTDEKRKKRTPIKRKEESKEERREKRRLKRLVEKELALLKNRR